jgi:alkylation response protein AidB-like acyl-CoA dehydrogenase
MSTLEPPRGTVAALLTGAAEEAAADTYRYVMQFDLTPSA